MNLALQKFKCEFVVDLDHSIRCFTEKSGGALLRCEGVRLRIGILDDIQKNVLTKLTDGH